jgi:aminoglycoside 6'-N-acetyltransferase
MMRIALGYSFSDAGVSAIVIDPLASNTRAHRFYRQLGFLPVERRRLGSDGDDCLVHRLDRAEWRRRFPQD